MRGATLRDYFIKTTGLFQSTRPMRGATLNAQLNTLEEKFQSTRPMRGATEDIMLGNVRDEFQSTRPMRGATMPAWAISLCRAVSIHAPHAGRDNAPVERSRARLSFNPRAPCGARQMERTITFLSEMFQSTRPMRGATQCGRYESIHYEVSIHAPHAGRDL